MSGAQGEGDCHRSGQKDLVHAQLTAHVPIDIPLNAAIRAALGQLPHDPTRGFRLGRSCDCLQGCRGQVPHRPQLQQGLHFTVLRDSCHVSLPVTPLAVHGIPREPLPQASPKELERWRLVGHVSP